MSEARVVRRLPVGAEVQPDGSVHFRVWAPRRQRVAVFLEEPLATGVRAHRGETLLTAEGNGYFSGRVPGLEARACYRFRLDQEEMLVPDPASRFQPQGPHGPSQVVDPGSFHWTDGNWSGVSPRGQVIYEMHIGIFTPEGTWAAASEQLPELARIGITLLEIMPVADFPGRFGWGYDGVDLFAPTRLYGTPDDFRRFVDDAHRLGLGVILDVVYNHFGPDGNYLKHFAEAYFTDRYKTDWGEAINYDGPDAAPVREFVTANAGYWIEEFHLDGLRLDATQNIYDSSADSILAAITRAVRQAARGRKTYVVAENEPQHVRLVRPQSEGGFGMDALWNDDFHHTALVALTGRREAYYTDYRGQPQEFISAAKWGYLYQGQRYAWQKQRRGTPALGLPPSCFVTFLENHDQVANSALGFRCVALTSPGRLRTLTALLLLGPGTPMLFQGQEFAASSPFLFFADHQPDLARLVQRGRADFLKQFPSIADPAMQALLAAPHDPNTFARCKLDFSERQSHAAWYALHEDLLSLRRQVLGFADSPPGKLDGAVLGTHVFLLRYLKERGEDWLLLFNLGSDWHPLMTPEPLLAPPEGATWKPVWSSEAPRYGGAGTPALDLNEGWQLPAESALIFQSIREEATSGG